MDIVFSLFNTLILLVSQENREDLFTIARTYLDISLLIDFSLSQAHSFLFVYWSINYAERVTNKRVAVLIASVKISILIILLIFFTCIGKLPEPNKNLKWICALHQNGGIYAFYLANLPFFLNFFFMIFIAVYNFKVVYKIMNQQVVPTISHQVTSERGLNLIERKLKNAKVFFRMNISTLLLYIPTLPMNIFLSYFNLSGEDCDFFDYFDFALFIGLMLSLHDILFPIIVKMKLKRFYTQVIH